MRSVALVVLVGVAWLGAVRGLHADPPAGLPRRTPVELKVQTRGTCSQGAIESAVLPRLGLLRRCVGAATGQARVVLTVASTGHVAAITVRGSLGEPVQACLKDRLRDVKVPRTEVPKGRCEATVAVLAGE